MILCGIGGGTALSARFDRTREREEGVFDVDVRFRTGLHELGAVFDRELFAAFARDLTTIVHVAFVADDDAIHVGRRVLLDVADPVLDVLEGLLVRDVVDEQDALEQPRTIPINKEIPSRRDSRQS